MKILLTMNLPYFPVLAGGANKGNRLLAEGLVQKGHSVKVIVPALDTDGLTQVTRAQFYSDLLAQGIEVASDAGAEVFNLNGVEVHAVVERSQLRAYLLDQIRKFEPDWTFVSSEDPSQNLLDAALKACRDRVIYLVHSPIFLPFGPQAFFPSPMRAKLLERPAAIVGVGNFVAEYIREWGGLEAKVIHLPVYGSGPFPHFGSFENGFVTMVNPCRVKGISIFLALARRLPECPFAAVPTWGTTDADRVALAELSNVRLLQPAKNIDEIFAQTRLLLVPSLCIEGLPMIVVEAMLRGIPVLASNSGGLPEAKLGTDYIFPIRPVERFTERLDQNRVPIPIVPEQEIGPWQDALSHLLSDRALYQKQSTAAREAALKFVSGLSVEPFEDLLLRLAAQSRADVHQAGPSLPDQMSRARVSDIGRVGESVADLTPEQQALLVLRLRKKALMRADRKANSESL